MTDLWSCTFCYGTELKAEVALLKADFDVASAVAAGAE